VSQRRVGGERQVYLYQEGGLGADAWNQFCVHFHGNTELDEWNSVYDTLDSREWSKIAEDRADIGQRSLEEQGREGSHP